jgi:hypothetical protein
MTTRQAPEIFQIPLDDLDPVGLPPRGTPEFEQAVVGRYALDYAARGWQAVVAVDDAFVRVVAVPERGVEPKAYVLGLLQSKRSASGVVAMPRALRYPSATELCRSAASTAWA